MAPPTGMTSGAQRGRSSTSPVASATARVAWLLGNDQSPGGGHSATALPGSPASARQGRSSSRTTFSTSLAP